MRILVFLRIIALSYLGLCILLFFIQRSLIYFPQPASVKGDVLTLSVRDAHVLAATREAAGPSALLYFGGNAEDVSRTVADLAGTFPGAALYGLHYRGYGGSTGSPSETALFNDALALFDHVHAAHPEVTIIGRSLGSAIAVFVASRRPTKRLVLVTPFDSLADAAAAHYPFLPVKWILRDKFESGRYAPLVSAPTLIVAAENDELIPRESTERLSRRFRPGLSTTVVLSGDHNSVSGDPRYVSLLADRP